jgi:hypothetical protein
MHIKHPNSIPINKRYICWGCLCHQQPRPPLAVALAQSWNSYVAPGSRMSGRRRTAGWFREPRVIALVRRHPVEPKHKCSRNAAM